MGTRSIGDRATTNGRRVDGADAFSFSFSRVARVLLLLTSCLCLGWPCSVLVPVHGRHHPNGGNAAHLTPNGEERLIGWKGETHSVAAASRAALLAKMDLGSTGACDLSGPGGDLEGAPLVMSSSAGTMGSQVAHPGEWVSRYDAVSATSVASVPLNYKHMAMIERLRNGSLALAWQTAPKIEGDARQHIVLTFAHPAPVAETRAGTPFLRWGEASRVEAIGEAVGEGAQAGKQGALWGPALLNDPTPGREHVLWLFYAESRGGCGSRVPGMDWAPGGDLKVTSLDLRTGRWTAPRLVLSQDADGGVPKVTANKPAVLSNGHWVLPYWRERAMLAKDGEACEAMRGGEGAGVVISEDGGATWKAHGNIKHPTTWLIENAVAELSTPRRLIMVFRTRVGSIFQSRSNDGGRTWSEASPLGMPPMPNPNAKIDLIRLDLGPRGGHKLALVFNDHKKQSRASLPGCSRCRSVLRVALSGDDGEHWDRVATVEDEVDHSLRIHYPTLTQRGCELLVAYSRFYKHDPPTEEAFGRQGIRVARVPLIRLPTDLTDVDR